VDVQDLADLLGAIAWPLIVLVAVILLRREIAGLMKRGITLTKGDATVRIDAVGAVRRVEEAAAALGAPSTAQDDGNTRSAADEAADRREQIEDLFRAATELGWVAGASGEEKPPRPTLDWTTEGAALVRGDLTSPEEWEMVKARFLVRLEDPTLTEEQRMELFELMEQIKRAKAEAIRALEL
jgi:hypothetical protein